MNIIAFFDSVGRDLRYALRGLLRRPGIHVRRRAHARARHRRDDRDLQRRLLGADQAAAVSERRRAREDQASPPRHRRRRLRCELEHVPHVPARRTGRLRASASGRRTSATLTDRGEPARVRALRVTDGTLQALGVQPMRGRWFTEAGARARGRGARAGHSLLCVLATAIRRRRSGARARALDRFAERQRHLARAASKSSASCRPTSDFSMTTPQPDVIVPVRLDPARQAHGIVLWQMLARLKPGVTLAEAHADLERMRPIWLDAWPPLPGIDERAAIANLRITPVVRPCRTTWSAASRACCGCSWVRSAPCSRSPAPTSRISCSCAPTRGGRSSPCAPRSARRRANRERVARRELASRRSRQRARLAARLRRTAGSRCDRPERPAAPSGDRPLSARARVHGGRIARVDARCSARSRRSSTHCASMHR